MSYKIYIGNLSFETSSEELAELFSAVGEVATVSIMSSEEMKLDIDDYIRPFVNKYEHKGRFGFIEMPSLTHARAAISKFQGIELPGRPGFLIALSGPHGGDKKP